MPALTIIAAPSTGPGNPQQGVQTSVTINENIGDNTLIGFVRINPALTYSWDVQGTTTLNWNGCYSFEQVVNPEGLPAGTYLRIFVTPGKGGEVNFNREVQDFGHDIGIVGKDANDNRVDVGSFEVTMRNVNEDPTKLGLTTFGGVNGGDTTPVGQEKVEHSIEGTIIGQLGSEDADGLADAATHKYTFVGGSNNGTVSSDGVFKIEQFTNQFNQIKYRVVINDASLYDYDSLPEDAKYFEHTIRVTDAAGLTFDRTFRIVPSNNTADDEPTPADPTLTGAAATVPAESTGANEAPFNGRLSVGYANNADQLTIEVSFAAANGVFQGQTAGGDATTKVYTFTGTRDAVNSWLAGLQFNPDDKFSGAATNTQFTVKVKPAAAATWSATNSNITVAADINDNATGTIPGADVPATVGTAMNPFANITVLDEENDEVTLTITFAPGGTWTGLTGTGLVTVTNQSATGTIIFKGKAGDVSAFLDGVGYTPASAGAKAFTVKVVDAFTGAGQHTETTVGSFNVTAAAATADPTITGAEATVNAESTGANVAPFNSRLSINYANNTDQLTVEVSFPAANGVFQGQTAGGDATTKVYTFTGTRDQVNTWLASLQFNPDDRFSGAATDTTFTVKVKPQAATTWSATNTNIHVTADINDNATGSIPGSDVGATVGTAMNPFADITVTDEENDEVTVTITFAPGGTWTGLTSTALVTVTNQSATGSITFKGKAGDVTAFLDGVGYTPASAGAKAFTVKVIDAFAGAGQHTETTVGSFNVTAAAANTPPPDPTAAVDVDERSPDGTEVLSMAETDGDGQTISYTFAVADPDSGGKTSLDGKFRIEGNKIVVNGDELDEVGGHTPLPPYAIVANDGSGGIVTGNVSITVKNVPVLSIGAITTGPFDEGDSGTVDYVFQVSRESIGSESRVKWRVEGVGIDANDFEILDGILDFDDDDQFQDIVLKVKGDRIAELTENFTIILSDPEGAAINETAGSAMGTITNDDHKPTLVIDTGEDYFVGPRGTAIAGVLAGVNLEDLDGADEELTLTVSFLNANGALDDGMTHGIFGGVTVTDDGTNPNGIRQFTLVGTAADIEAFLAQRSFTPATAGVETKFSFTLKDTEEANSTAYGEKISVLSEFPGNHAPDRPMATAEVHESKEAGFVVVTLDEDGVDEEGTVIDYKFFAAQAGNDKISGDGRFEIVGNKIVVRDISALGQQTYVVQTSDGTYTVQGNVTITVKNNLGPTIASITASGGGQAGTPGTILVSETAGAVEIGTVAASDQDAAQDGRALSYSLENTYDGLFAIDAAGKIRIANASKLPVNGDTPYTLKVMVSDGTDTTQQTVTVQVKESSTNAPPTALKLNGTNGASILEYTLVGTEIGTLSASDANTGDVLTYKLLDDAGGRFAIDGNKLKLAGAGVNFEEAMSHQIKVQASDGKGGVTEQVFTVGVGDQLTLNKRGTKKNDKLNGSALDDILKGGSRTGKDTIKGLSGDDKLYGEGGNDKLYGGDGLDNLYGGSGNDTLRGEAGKDFLKGDAGNDKVYGGLGDDKLYGGAGNDTLKGDTDNDVLFGEAGNDKLYGGAGNDTFVFNKKASKAANFDRIYDFKSGQDKLFLDNSVFKKLGKLGTFDVPAKLDVSMFKTGKAKDRNDYLVYKNGILSYDADGSGKGAAVEIVKVKGLKVADIFII